MAVSKVVYAGSPLIDLTGDSVTEQTLKKGYTAHRADGQLIVGTFEGDDTDMIDRILTAGLTDGYKHFSDDGTIISTVDSQGRTLTKTFSDDFLTCTTVLTGPDGEVLGKTTKSFSPDSSTIITTDSKGQKLVKTFSEDLKSMEAILTDASNEELARMNKIFSDDEKSIVSTVEYGK